STRARCARTRTVARWTASWPAEDGERDGLPDAERRVRRWIDDAHAHGKALREPHPVERRLDGRKEAGAGPVALLHRPADALHFPAQATAGVIEDVDLRGHAGADVAQERLAEVPDDVPGARVDEREDLAPLEGVVALGDVEVGDVAVERRRDAAIFD